MPAPAAPEPTNPSPSPPPAAGDFVWTVETTGGQGVLTALWGDGPGNVWAVGGGSVLHSSGDGRWTALRNDTDASYQAVFAADGFIFVGGTACQGGLCQGGVLLRSADGGASWTTQPVGAGVTSFTRHGATLYLDSGDVYASSDHFSTLRQVPLGWPTSNGVWADGGALHAFGGLRGGEIRRSTDGGVSWSTVFDGIAGSKSGHLDAMVAGTRALYAIGNGCSVPACQGGVVRSDDDGATWRITRLPVADLVAGLWAVNDAELFVGGAALQRSIDGGASFAPLTLPLTKQWHAIWGSSANDLYVAGDDGTVVHGKR